MIPAVQLGESQLRTRPVAAGGRHLDLVPGHPDIAQTKQELVLDTHDGRDAPGSARLLDVDQRLHRPGSQIVEHRSVAQRREIAARCPHVGHLLDQTFGLLRDPDDMLDGFGIVRSVLLGERHLALACGAAVQGPDREVQHPVRIILIGQPPVARLAQRNVELDIGRHRNIERLLLDSDEIGLFLCRQLRFDQLRDLQRRLALFQALDLHRGFARSLSVILPYTEIGRHHVPAALRRARDRPRQPTVVGSGNLGRKVARIDIRRQRHGHPLVLRVGQTQFGLRGDLDALGNAARNRDAEGNLLVVHPEGVVGDLLRIGLVGLDIEDNLGSVLAAQGRRRHEIRLPFERPGFRTGHQHRHLAALAGQVVRQFGIVDLKLGRGFGGLLLEGDLERHALLAAGEGVGEETVDLLVVGLDLERDDVAVLALHRGRGHQIVPFTRKAPGPAAGDLDRHVAALAADGRRRRIDRDGILDDPRLHFLVSLVAGAAEKKRRRGTDK